jgi:hypothetical protein
VNSKEINAFIKKHWKRLSDHELAAKCRISKSAIEHRRDRLNLNRLAIPIAPKEAVEQQTRKMREADEKKAQRDREKYLIEENGRLQRELTAALSLTEEVKPRSIIKSASPGGEATMIALASDWHIEERVRPGDVNGLNEYTLEIAQRRADHYFSTLLRLIEIEQQNTKVDHVVLALLGDFITGDIHEELVEITDLEPTFAARRAEEIIVSGIEHLLAKSKLKITCIAHSGNHARTTKDQRHSTENGHSLEWLIYMAMKDRYHGNPRVQFHVPQAYHSYLTVYDKTIRFHHGHAINYGGGVGGITIPVRKAIAQWNTLKTADVDCFGHFHQSFDGGNFVCNGSMIGYNAYALSIKAAYEEPIQMLFGIHSKLGKYITRSIKFIYD